MREIKVELRKQFLQPYFYLAWFIFNGIMAFLSYQLCNEGAIVRIEGSENVTYDEIMTSIIILAHQVGLVAVILALLCWQTFGKETDQRYMTCYVLSTRDKWTYIFAKVAVVTFSFTLIIICTIATMIGIYELLQPTHLSFALNGDTWSTILQHVAVVILCGTMFISLTAVISLRFGVIGVLFTTVGLAIVSSIFSQNLYIKDFIPLNLLTISESQSFFQHAGLLTLYIFICLVGLRFYTKHKEIAV
ncbi:hypothetical protein [Lysinibacillus sp. LZ02]|uniref:hypothetical protein n=1 Tax=Lysinibacillus sp. LZ02 TaxID=3420668 RepID=UPI003D36ED2D